MFVCVPRAVLLRRAREERRRGIRDVIAKQINDISAVYVMRERERERDKNMVLNLIRHHNHDKYIGASYRLTVYS